MMKRSFYILSLLVLMFVVYFSQSTKKIEAENKRLVSIKEQISNLENEIHKLSSNAKTVGEELSKIDEQIFLYEKIINQFIKKISQERSTINSLSKQVSLLTQSQIKLKRDLEKYLIYRYKQREVTWLDFILDSKSYYEISEMKYYDEYFTKKIDKLVKNIDENKSRLAKSKSLKIEKEKELKLALIETKKNQNILVKKQKDKKHLLLKIQGDKKNKNLLIAQKRIDEEKIAKLIENLIKEEIARLERERLARIEKNRLEKIEKSNKEKEREKYNYISGVNFQKLYGKLPYPVYGGKVVQKFGKVKNKSTNTVSLSSGVNLKVKSKMNVRAVADGLVSVVQWLPGFGSIVIINHGNEYKTVYGNVENLMISEGEEIKSGDKIGVVSESIEGNVLHFQLWKGKEAQNPESWFVKK